LNKLQTKCPKEVPNQNVFGFGAMVRENMFYDTPYFTILVP